LFHVNFPVFPTNVFRANKYNIQISQCVSKVLLELVYMYVTSLRNGSLFSFKLLCGSNSLPVLWGVLEKHLCRLSENIYSMSL